MWETVEKSVSIVKDVAENCDFDTRKDAVIRDYKYLNIAGM